MNLDTAAQVALYIFLCFTAIFALVTISLLFALAFGLTKLNEKLESALDSVRPLITKSTEVLETVERVTVSVGERADAILSQGEQAAATVAKTVDRTTSVVENAVSGPLIDAASIFAGLTRGLRSFSRASRTRNTNNHF